MIASVTARDIFQDNEHTLSSEIDDKLLSLHSYYVIGQKNLIAFDDSLSDLSLEELYHSTPYMNLLAVKTQVDEIEGKLLELKRTEMLKERVKQFAAKSDISFQSMANLSARLKMIPTKTIKTNAADIDKEIRVLETMKEFMIFEKNIEHLSHMMDLRFKDEARKFKPSEGALGNLSGQEFPSKVWSLTFDNGPHPENSEEIIKNLKERDLKATFFFTTMNAKKHLPSAKSIRDAGMEIGSHSYSHKELTKVGGITLDKEITQATNELEKDLKIEIQFFRLPYAAGVTVPGIRETIARNNLIHVFWNVDTLDWLAQSPDRIVKRTRKMMSKTQRDAGIILFHETSERSVLASAEIMNDLKTNGRRNCTLGKIVQDMNKDLKTICSRN